MYLNIFFCLCLSSLFLWLPKLGKILPLLGCLVAFILAVVYGLVSPTGVLLLIIFFVVCYLFGKVTSVSFRIITGFILSVAIFIATSQYLPWFKNIALLDNVKLSLLSKPFTMQLNLSKDFCGLIMAILLITWNKNVQDWKNSLRVILIPLCCLVVILMGPAIMTHFVKFDFKIPHESALFILDNLLLVCVVEEVFFRGFIQAQLKKLFLYKQYNPRISSVLAIIISALYFGFAHYHSGVIMIILAAIAGVGYGFVFNRSGRIESAILTHFGLNFIHFLFFTYPALAK